MHSATTASRIYVWYIQAIEGRPSFPSPRLGCASVSGTRVHSWHCAFLGVFCLMLSWLLVLPETIALATTAEIDSQAELVEVESSYENTTAFMDEGSEYLETFVTTTLPSSGDEIASTFSGMDDANSNDLGEGSNGGSDSMGDEQDVASQYDSSSDASDLTSDTQIAGSAGTDEQGSAVSSNEGVATPTTEALVTRDTVSEGDGATDNDSDGDGDADNDSSEGDSADDDSSENKDEDEDADKEFDNGCAQVLELGADGYFESAEGYGNAIQRAINAALAHVSDMKGEQLNKVTIVVYEGVYDGSLAATLARTITRDGSTEQTHYKLPSGFTIVFIADEVRDATTEEGWLASTGKSTINGSLTVEDMSLEVYGIGFKGNSISLSKGKVENKSGTVDHFIFYGTALDDEVTFTLKEVKNYYINTGDGADVINVSISRGSLENFTEALGKFETGAGNDSISLGGTDSKGGYVININLGEGDDVITVDTSLRNAANTLKGGSVTIDAGTGTDRVHLVGKLTKIDSEKCPVNIRGNRDKLTIIGGLDDKKENSGDLDLSFVGVEGYTDELSEKKKVELKVGSGGRFTMSEALESFTDYVLIGEVLTSVVFTDANPELFLSTLKTSATTISQLIAPSLNVRNVTENAGAGVSDHKGQRIGLPSGVDAASFANMYGNEGFVGIRARNIILRDSDSDNYSSGATLKIPSAISWALDGKEAIDLATWNFTVNSAINIDASATLDASEFVVIEVSSSQEKGLFPTTIPYVKINAVTLKWGSATITVKGTIKAGGSVNMSASGRIKIDATVEVVPIPIAIAYAALDVATYLDGATINAGGAVSANSIASANLVAKTVQDLSPIMAAINIGLVYSETSAKGATITAGSDVRLNATSSLTQSATAKYDGTTKSSGGFFTVNVSDQDATAVVDDGTSIDAGGIVSVRATANQSAYALASSGNSVDGYRGEESEDDDNFSSGTKTKDGVDTSDRESKWSDLDFSTLFDLVKGIFGKAGEDGSSNNQITGKIGSGLSKTTKQLDNGNANVSDDDLVDRDNASTTSSTSLSAADESNDAGSGSDSAPNVTDVFDTALSSSSGKVSDAKTSRTHVAGAIAVSVVNNAADAHVASGARIKSGGRLSVLASASTSASTTADASMAVSDIGSATNPTTSDGTVTTTAQQKKMGTENYHKDINIVTGTYGDPDDSSTTIWVATNGGSYSATGSTIEVSGGREIKNEGGKVQIKEGGSLLEKNQIQILGGTTTIEHVDVTIDAGKDGTLKWTAGEENGQAYVDIFNKNKTTTKDGEGSTVLEGGTVRIWGGTLTIQNGVKVTLKDVTMVVKNGMLYIEYRGSDPDVHVTQDESAKTATITGNFDFKSTAGGDVSFAVEGPVNIEKATAKLSKIYVHSIKVSSSRMVNIDRIGGEEKSNQADDPFSGSETKLSEIKDDSVGTSLNVSVDLTSGKDSKISFEGTATNSDEKDAEGTLSLGEVKTSGEGDEATTNILMWLVSGGKIKLSENATLTLPTSALYRIVNGTHGSMRDDTTNTYNETWTGEGGQQMTIYVDFKEDFSLEVDGSYSGKMLFSSLIFKPKKAEGATEEPESLKGRYTLSDATVTLEGGVTLIIKKGRLTITGAKVTIPKDKDGNKTGDITITGGTLAFTMGDAKLDLGTNGKMTIKDGKISLQPSKENTEQTALGAGVAVNVHSNSTTAYVDKNAVVHSGGLEVVATTTNAHDGVAAHAGFSNADTAVGGAIAVQVTNFKTIAEVREGADVTLSGGPLTVRASAVTTLTTTADAPVSTKGTGTGVGAGIAVEVAGIETTAKIADGTVKRANATTLLDSVTVEASQKMPKFAEFPNKVNASAGASGGTAVTPALALIVGGSQVLAYLGAGESIEATGDVSISSYNEVEREQDGNAAASGSSVGVGGAFAIAVLNDSSTAKLRRSIRGRNVSVRATGIQRTKTSTKSGVKGTPSQDKSDSDSDSDSGGGSSGSDSGNDSEGDQSSSDDSSGNSSGSSEDANPTADEMVDGFLSSGKRLGTLSRSNCLSSDQLESLLADRQKAETSEGSVSVAAAFSLTVAKNVVLAEIADGCDADALDGDLSVEVIRDTDSKVVANGATTTAKTGIGVGVAISVVNTEGTARIGTGAVSATGDIAVRSLQLDDSEDEEEAGDTLDVFIEFMKKMADDLLASVTEETGLQGIAALIHGTLTDKLKARWSNIEKTLEKHKNEIFGMVAKNLMNMVFSRFASNITWDWKSGLADLDEVVESIAKDVCADLFDTGKLKSYITGNITEIIKIANKTLNRSLNDIRRAFFGFLAKAFGQGEDAPASTYVTYAIAGAGASDIGVAGSVAIAVVNANNSATIAGHEVINPSDDVTSGGTLTIVAETSETFDTVATAAVTDGELPEKNKDAKEKADSDTTTVVDNSGNTSNGSNADSDNSGDGSGDSSDDSDSSSVDDSDSAKGVGVGAGFAFVYSNLDCKAELGANRRVSANALDIHANAANKVETYAVAGTDPLKDTSETQKETAIDASVALNIIDVETLASVAAGNIITVTGSAQANPVEYDEKNYAFVLAAKTDGTTLSKASGFACGDSTAVGAAVCVNIVTGATEASFAGEGTVTGKVLVDAIDTSGDDAVATATAMGADLQRYFTKFANGVETLNEWADKLANGKVELKAPKPKSNKTSSKIVSVLNNVSNTNDTSEGATPSRASEGSSLSTNILNTQDVSTVSNPPTSEGTDAVTSATNQTSDPTDSSADTSKKKVLVAAAVAVNVVAHKAHATVRGKLVSSGEAGGITVDATNKANYRAYATGAAMTASKALAAIGAAVAVGVNSNEAIARVERDAQSSGGFNVTATLTQNMDGTYAGLLAAQTIAGAASGSGSTATVAGAISVLVAKGTVEARIADGISVSAVGDMTVKAYNKSKYAMRAGALSASGGSSVGVGASFALIYARDAVRAMVGKNTRMSAHDLSVSAERAMVTFSDYALGKDWSALFEIAPAEDKEDQDDDAIDDAKTKPIITITQTTTGAGENEKVQYGVEINVDTDTVLGAIDLLNFLSSTNYYAEAISGAISGSNGANVSVAGSFAFVFGGSTVEALIDEGAVITLTGSLAVTAISGSNTRIIAGSLSASGAKVGVGATISAYVDTRITTARIAKNANVTAGGNATVSARGSEVGFEDEDKDGKPDGETIYRSADVLVIAVAPAVGTGKVAVGATVPVIVTEDVYTAEIADGSYVSAEGNVLVVAQTSSKLLPIALAIAATSGDVAVGGNVLVIVAKTKTHARVGANAVVSSTAGSIRIAATSDEFLVMVLPSVGVSSKVGVAATIAAVVSRSDTAATVGEAARVHAKSDATVQASSESFMVAVSVAAGGGKTAGVGAVVNVFVFDRDVRSELSRHATLTSDEGDIVVKATAKDYAVIVAVGAAGAGTAAVSGTIPVLVSKNRVRALIGSYDKNPSEHSDARLEAGANVANGKATTSLTATRGSIGVIADYDTKTYLAAGGFSGAGTVAVGATILTAVMQNRVQGLVGFGAELLAGGSGAGIVLPSESDANRRRRGIAVSTNLKAETLLVGISGGAAGTVAVGGTIVTGVFEDVAHAIIYGGGSTRANADDSEGDLSTSSDSEGKDLAVIATATSDLKLIGGSLSAAGTVGVGATVVTLVYDRGLEASVNAYDAGTVYANNIEIRAGANKDGATTDEVWIFAVSISGAGTVAVGAGVSVLYHDSRSAALLDGSVIATGDIHLAAHSSMRVVNAAAGVAGSGVASVSGIVIVTYFRSVTKAEIDADAIVSAAGNVTVEATSAESTNVDAVGITGSGTAAVSGTVATVFTYVTTTAKVGERVKITATSLTVKAEDSFKLLGIVGTVAASGVAGVGVTALIGTSHNSVEARIASNAVITCTGDVNVTASGERDVQIYLATVAAGGVAGVGVNVLVFVAGGNISQDSADAVRGDGEHNTFDGDQLQDGLATTLLGDDTDKGALGKDTAAGASVAKKLKSSKLSEELAGDGTKMSDTKVATDGDFDVTGDFGMAGDADYSQDGNSAIPDKGNYSTSDLHEVTELTKAGEHDLGSGTVPVIAGSDAVRAIIATAATVIARDVSISATDTLTLDLMAFSVAGAGIAGVAPSIVVGATYANAIAAIENGATITAMGNVSVSAKTGSKVVTEGDDANEKSRNASVKKNVGNGADEDAKSITFNGQQYTIFTARGVRAISAAGGGGLVGVGIAISYLGLDSNAYAYIAGDIKSAQDVSVSATTYFPLVASATFGVGAGLVGVTFSGSFAFARGMAYAGIVGVARLTDITGNVAVTSDTTFNAASFAAALAGGGVAVNGAVAVTDDRMDVYTFVGKAVALDVAGTLSVKATGLVAGGATVLGASVGAIAVGINVGVVNVRPTILSFVGSSPLSSTQVVGANGTGAPASLGGLTVSNDFATSANASLFGVAAGAISAAGNVIVVTNSTVARASVFDKDLNVSGEVTISSALSDEAKAGLVSATAGFITLGANTFVAHLTSDNRAIVDTTGASFSFGSLVVRVGDESAPNLSSAVAAGMGASSGAIAVSVNVGVASNDTVNNAEIIGTGTLSVAGPVVVSADGRATASASMNPGVANISGASVAANVVLASVTATQLARMGSGAHVVTGGGAITLASRFNVASEKNSFGATAKTGSNGGVSVNIIGVGVSVAKAKMNATVRAIVEDATVDTKASDGSAGELKLVVHARSNASTDVIAPTVSISGASVGVIVTRADAAGTFEARFAGSGTVGSTSVTTDYGSDSYGATGPTGGLAAGLVKIDVNVATATVTTKATAAFEGTDSVHVLGNLAVTTKAASVKSTAEGKTYQVTVAGVKVAVNDVTATLAATQAAELVISGSFEAAGDVSVSSTLETETVASVGSSAGVNDPDFDADDEDDDDDWEISLIGVTVNTARATSTGTNTAIVRGAGADTCTLNVNSLNVFARSKGASNAYAKTSTAVGLVAIGGLSASASAGDVAKASLEGITVRSTNTVNVRADAHSDAYASSSAPGGLSLWSSKVASATTDLGTAARPVSANAMLGDGSVVIAGGDVTILASSNGSTQAQLKVDSGFSLVGATVQASLTTRANLAAAATVGDDARISSKGSVSISSSVLTTITEEVKASALGGITVSVATARSKTELTQNATTSVGKRSVIEALADVSIGSSASATQLTNALADAKGGFTGKSDLKAESTLTRTVLTLIDEGARIVSDGGNISIFGNGGTSDQLSTSARVSAKSFAGFPHVRSEMSINSDVSVTIASDVAITNTFGTVTIDARSETSVDNVSNSYSKGVGGEPEATSNTTLKLDATTTIGAADAKIVTIIGKDVQVASNSNARQVQNSASATADDYVGANNEASSKVFPTIRDKTIITNAELRGYDSVSLTSSGSGRLDADAYANIYAIGEAEAYAYVDNPDVQVVLSLAGTSVYSAKVTLFADEQVVCNPDTHSNNPWYAKYKHESKTRGGSITQSISIAEDCAFYLGGSAAGVAIDISYDSNGAARVRTAGIPSLGSAWRQDGNTIVLAPISGSTKGTLDAYTKHLSSKQFFDIPISQIFDQSAIPFIDITNRTDYALVLSAIATENAMRINPTINGVTKQVSSASDVVSPKISVESKSGADVTVGGFIMNTKGSLRFAWTGEAKGRLLSRSEWLQIVTLGTTPVAPIWTHELIIDAAASVGEGVRFNAYLFWHKDEAPTLFVDALGNVVLGLADAKLLVGEPQAATARTNALGAENIHTPAAIDLIVHSALTVYRNPESAQLVSIPIPGALEYVTGAFEEVEAPFAIDRSALAIYLTGVDSQGRRSYSLPNGTTYITDASGALLSIVDQGIETDVTEFSTTINENGDLVMSVEDGIWLNLTKGVLELAEDRYFEIEIEHLVGIWLEFMFFRGGSPADGTASDIDIFTYVKNEKSDEGSTEDNLGNETTSDPASGEEDGDDAYRKTHTKVTLVLQGSLFDSKSNTYWDVFGPEDYDLIVDMESDNPFAQPVFLLQVEQNDPEDPSDSTVKLWRVRKGTMASPDSTENEESGNTEDVKAKRERYLKHLIEHATLEQAFLSIDGSEQGVTRFLVGESENVGADPSIVTLRGELTEVVLSFDMLPEGVTTWTDGAIREAFLIDEETINEEESLRSVCYIACDGTFYFIRLKGDQIIYQAWLRSGEGFSSSSVNLAFEPDTQRTMNSATIKAGQNVMLELLGPDVARSATGKHYVLVTDDEGVSSWVLATATTPTDATTTLVFGGVSREVSLQTYEVSHEGIIYLTVRTYIDPTTRERLLVEHVLSNGLSINSEGTVSQTSDTIDKLVIDAGSSYSLSGIEGSSVLVTLEDEASGAGFVARDDSTAISSNTITFSVPTGTSVGTETSRLMLVPLKAEDPISLFFDVLHGSPSTVAANVHLAVAGNALLPERLAITSAGKLDIDARGTLDFGAIIIDSNGSAWLCGKTGIMGKGVSGDTGSTIALASDADINSKDAWLVIDLPDGSALSIERAASYYVRGIEADTLPGYDLSLPVDVPSDVSGLATWLYGRIVEKPAPRAKEALDLLVSSGLLARWLMGGLAQDPSALVLLTHDADVATLIANGDIEGFSSWLKSSYSDATLTVDALAQLSSSLLAQVNTAGEALHGSGQAGDVIDAAYGTTLAPIIALLLDEADLAGFDETARSAAVSNADLPRALTITVGEASGLAHVKNRGNVSISQRTGTLKVGQIVSQVGDVTLSSGGAIEGDAGSDTHVSAAQVHLSAGGDVGTVTSSLVIDTGSVLSAGGSVSRRNGKDSTPVLAWDEQRSGFVAIWDVVYPHMSRIDGSACGRLTISNANDVTIAEVPGGSLGLGSIAARGQVTLAADALVDAHTMGESAPNITAPKVTLISSTGSVGDSAAPILIDTDAATGTVNAISAEGTYLREVAGDLRVGAIVAGADVLLEVPNGAIVDEDVADRLFTIAQLLERARVAESASEAAATSAHLREADIAQLEAAFERAQAALEAAEAEAEAARAAAEEATRKAQDDKARADTSASTAHSAQLKADASKQTAEKLSALLAKLREMQASEDVDNSELTALYQEIADELGVTVEAVDENLLAERLSAAEIAAANDAVAAGRAQDDADAADAASEGSRLGAEAANAATVRAEEARVDAEQSRNGAKQALDALQAEHDALLSRSKDKAREAQQLREQAAALSEGQASISIATSADLDLLASDLGTTDNALSLAVGGTLRARSTKGERFGVVHVEAAGDLVFTPIAADSATLVAEGAHLAQRGSTNAADVTGELVTLRSVTGAVGSAADPIRVAATTLNASGTNVYVTSAGNLSIGTVAADEVAYLESAGDITCAEGSEGVMAKQLHAHADGEVSLRSAGIMRTWTTAASTPKLSYDDPYLANATRMLTFDLAGGSVDGHGGTLRYFGLAGDTIELPLPSRPGYAFDYWWGSMHYAYERYLLADNHHFEAVWKSLGDENETDASWSTQRLAGSPFKTLDGADARLAATGDSTPKGAGLLALVGFCLLAGAFALRRRYAL